MEKVIDKEKLEKVDVNDDDTNAELIILNDDYNTFEHVITSLKRFCGLSHDVAEVCTWKIHSEGECVVLKNKKSVLFPICENLVETGLSAEIQDTDE